MEDFIAYSFLGLSAVLCILGLSSGMKGLVSKKTGKQYDATVLLETNEEGKARFKLVFPENNKENEA